MGVQYNMTGVPQETLQGRKLQLALGMGIPELTQIANSGRTVNGVDSLTAVMALQIKGPAEKAQRQQQAANQPPKQTVKDQVVAEAAPEDVGIGALPAGDVMTERGMASGGIVAFQGGGSVEELTRQIAELRRRRQALNMQAGPTISARGGDTLQRQKDLLDEQIAQLENQFRTAQGRDQEYRLQRGLETAPGIPFQTPNAPTAGADQGQQPPTGAGAAGVAPSGFGGSSLAGFPAVGPALKAAQAALKARGEFDPFASLPTFDTAPYESVLPMTPEQIREEMGKSRTQLDAMFPEKTREEVEQRLAQRYAGLEEMFKQREGRAEEAKKEAESEKGRTAGIGLMQLASELVTKPLTRIDTAAAFQTFKDANTDFRKAQKEYREGLDKIAEARELQKIGQAEKADDLFRQGALARFNFENEVTKAGILQDAVRKSGVRDIFDKKTNAQLAKYDAAVKSAELGLSTAVEGQKLRSAQDVANIYASSRLGAAGGRFTYEEARTKARTEMPFDVFQKDWITSGASKQTGRTMPSKEDYERAIDALARSILSANEAYYSGQSAAPSGGGAGGLDLSQWGDPRLKTR